MLYCLNPSCTQPKNPNKTKVCQTCGSDLKLNGRYLVGKTLGQGGFGATFLAVDTRLPGKPIGVIKQLRPMNTTAQFLKMARELFKREAETLGKLGNHPQIPRLLDYFEEKQQFFLVQEFVKGCNLQKEVKKYGAFTEAEVRQFLAEVLPLLDYIHQQKVIHRDLKPANVIRREFDQKLVLIDFGAVKNKVNEVMAADLSSDNPLTAYAVGTPGYSPPEQMSMRPTYASDIYSLGATCLYLLTATSPRDLGYRSDTGALDWEQYVEVSDHLKGVLRKMLEISVRNRYQSAKAVLDALKMEEYGESFSQGLVKQKRVAKAESEEKQSSRYSQRKSTAREAELIRERRTRIGLPTSQGAPMERSQANYSGSLTRLGKAKSSSSRRLTAEEVTNQYRKGRRDFSQGNFYQRDLEEADLRQSIFRDSNLMQVNLSKADLREADFANGDLRRASFQEAKLANAFFSNANLEKANFQNADLTLVNFQNAKLQEADFRGANLTNAKITEKQLAQAQTNWKTVYPNGKRGWQFW